MAFLNELGGDHRFSCARLSAPALTTDGNFRPIMAQIAYVSFPLALSTVAFSGVFVGAILVLQFNLMLAQYDAQSFLGGLNTSAVIAQSVL